MNSKLKKIALALATVAATTAANASVTLNYSVYKYDGVSTMDVIFNGIVGGYVSNPTLASVDNKTPYLIKFFFTAAPTVTSIQWNVASNEQLNGAMSFAAGGTLNDLTASTYVKAGTGYSVNGAGNISTITGQFFTDAAATDCGIIGNCGTTYGVGAGFNVPQVNSSGTGSHTYTGNTQDSIWVWLNSSTLSDTTGNITNNLVNYANVFVSADITEAPPPSAPEPTSTLLVGLGLLGAAMNRRMRKS